MPTETTLVDPKSFRPADLAPALQVLSAGGLVAFPTETVYHVGVRADRPEAVLRLARLFESSPGAPAGSAAASADEPALEASLMASYLASTPEAALALAGPPPPRVRPLVRRFWPGPLTVVLADRHGDPVALRVPAHPVAKELLHAAGVPLRVVWAKRPLDAQPATDGAGALERFQDRVDHVIDAGATTLREPSTIVVVGPIADTAAFLRRAPDRKGWFMQREGIVSEDMLRRALDASVLFVCTGNSCRSPMAEGLFRRKLSRRLEIGDDEVAEAGYLVHSAGTSAEDGGEVSEGAVRALQERAIDIKHHRSRSVTLEMVEAATLVVAMTPGHAATLARWWPEHREKFRVIDEAGIPDPIGGPIEQYRECADAIDARLDAILDKVLA